MCDGIGERQTHKGRQRPSFPLCTHTRPCEAWQAQDRAAAARLARASGRSLLVETRSGDWGAAFRRVSTFFRMGFADGVAAPFREQAVRAHQDQQGGGGPASGQQLPMEASSLVSRRCSFRAHPTAGNCFTMAPCQPQKPNPSSITRELLGASGESRAPG